MQGRLRVGIVGIGFGQHVHVPAFRSDSRCTVTALCASSIERARTAAEHAEIPRAFGFWHDLVTDPEIDVVSVAVPPRLQPAVVLAAVAAGKHVFCEKPVAMDLADAERMLEAARAARIVHAIDFEFPEIPSWQRARELCADGTLGTLRQVALSWRIETRAVRECADSWKLRAATGGGTLNNFVSHSLYYLEWMFGRIARVAARMGPPGAPDDLRVDAWLDFDRGLPATVSVSADAFLGSGHRLEVYGDRGTLALENTSADYVRNFVLLAGTRASGRLAPVVDERGARAGDGRIEAVGSLVRRFVDAVIAGGTMQPNLEDGLRVQILIQALRQAHESGRWQPV